MKITAREIDDLRIIRAEGNGNRKESKEESIGKVMNEANTPETGIDEKTFQLPIES